MTKRKPKLTVIEGGKKDSAPFSFEMFFPFAWWTWWLK